MFASSRLHRISAATLGTVLLCSVSLLLISSTYLVQIAFAQAKPVVAYTGKTYGYLRNDKFNNPEGDLADDFIRTLCYIKVQYPQALLVGMGDNFAPDYRARYYDYSIGNQMNPVPRLNGMGPQLSPAIRFFKSFPLNTFPAIDCKDLDQRAGYDVMVPGQLDFYFGADFLRRAGNHFGMGTDVDLPLLASNLVIQPTKQPATPARQRSIRA